MAFVIISSLIDPASINIKDRLIEQSKWEENDTFDKNPVFINTNQKDVQLITINNRKITRENIDIEIEEKLNIKPKVVLFISRHTSKMKKPTLTVHPIGNYGKAEFGGKPRTVVKSSPHLMTNLLRLIKKNYSKTNLEYEVCFEVTHHGPYLQKPTLFVEIGSTEKEWENKESAAIIAKSILELIQDKHYEEDYSKKIPVLMGVGGGHYAPRFTDIINERQAVFGHMIPTYQINAGIIDEEMLDKTIASTPNLKGVYIHKKALKKSQISEIKNCFLDRSIPVISSKDLPQLC